MSFAARFTAARVKPGCRERKRKRKALRNFQGCGLGKNRAEIVKDTKKRSFLEKFTGGGAGKTEPTSREWRREAAASRINQKRATRVKPSRPYFFVAEGRKEKGFITEGTEKEHRGH
jgi:hypothetical protein